MAFTETGHHTLHKECPVVPGGNLGRSQWVKRCNGQTGASRYLPSTRGLFAGGEGYTEKQMPEVVGSGGKTQFLCSRELGLCSKLTYMGSRLPHLLLRASMFMQSHSRLLTPPHAHSRPFHALTLSVLFLALSCCSSCEIWLAEFSRSLVRLAWSRCTSSTSWAISRSLAANSTSRLDRVSTSVACSWEEDSNDETARAQGRELQDLPACN